MSDKNQLPQSGKSDLIEGILLGSKQAKSARLSEHNTAAYMVDRLQKIYEETSCEITEQQAKKAIEWLNPFLYSELPVDEKTRKQIYTNVSAIQKRKKITA